MSLAQILTDYHIRHESNGSLELCLDDFVQYIVESKTESSIRSYLSRIKPKTKRNGLWYKDAEVVISELCPKARSKKAKELHKRWRGMKTPPESTDAIQSTEEESVIESEETDTVASFLDIRNNYFQYKGKKVFVIIKDGAVWFKGIDIARLLEIDATAQAIQQINDEDKRTFVSLRVGLNVPNHRIDPQTKFININGVKSFLIRSRKLLRFNIAKIFGIELLNQKWVCEETKYMSKIIHIFGKYHNYKTQYTVQNYRIDLYFTDLNLAIECDEYGHSHYGKDHEQQRTLIIEQHLKCKWIRFDPYDKHFDFSDVLRQIYEHIYNYDLRPPHP